jgi:putative zinc finger protein
MTTDEHAEIEALISALQDNAATPEEVARVERHIAGCARCRATAAAYLRVDQQVRRYIMATPVPEIATPWHNEPLIVPVRRGGAGLGHWRITLVGLATIFVLLLAGSLLTFRSLGLGQPARESNPTSVAQVASGAAPTATTVPATGLPTAAAALVPAPAAAPAASAAPANSAVPAAGGAPAPAASSAPRSASGSAASAAPSAAPAASAAASAAPAQAPPAATPAPTRAAASGTARPGSTPAFDTPAFNPVQAYRLASATSLTICRPACDAQPQPADVLQKVVAALDQPLAPAFVPPSTVTIPYVTLRFTLADGQQIDLGLYAQVYILQMPDGKGTFAAPPDLVAALAGSGLPR